MAFSGIRLKASRCSLACSLLCVLSCLGCCFAINVISDKRNYIFSTGIRCRKSRRVVACTGGVLRIRDSFFGNGILFVMFCAKCLATTKNERSRWEYGAANRAGHCNNYFQILLEGPGAKTQMFFRAASFVSQCFLHSRSAWRCPSVLFCCISAQRPNSLRGMPFHVYSFHAMASCACCYANYTCCKQFWMSRYVVGGIFFE